VQILYRPNDGAKALESWQRWAALRDHTGLYIESFMDRVDGQFTLRIEAYYVPSVAERDNRKRVRTLVTSVLRVAHQRFIEFRQSLEECLLSLTACQTVDELRLGEHGGDAMSSTNRWKGDSIVVTKPAPMELFTTLFNFFASPRFEQWTAAYNATIYRCYAEMKPSRGHTNEKDMPATAYAHRHALWLMHVNCLWTSSQSREAERTILDAKRNMMKQLRATISDAQFAYAGYAEPDMAVSGLPVDPLVAYLGHAHARRVRAVKTAYDPHNLFNAPLTREVAVREAYGRCCPVPPLARELCDDGRLRGIECRRCRWMTMADCVGSVPVILSRSVDADTASARSSLAVCFTGQTSRVELDSKVRHLFPELGSFSVSVFGAFGNGLSFRKQKQASVTAANEFTSIHTAKLPDVAANMLSAANVQSVWVYEYSQRQVVATEAPFADNHSFVLNLNSFDRRGAVETHLAQFDSMRRTDYLVQAYEQRHRMRFDHVLRIREDGYVVAPIDVRALVAHLDVTRGDVITNACGKWSGVNDHFSLMRRSVMYNVFTAQLRGFFNNILLRSEDFLWNPESLLDRQLRADNVSVIEVPPCDLPIVTIRHMLQSTCIDHGDFKTHIKGFSCADVSHVSVRNYTRWPKHCTRTGHLQRGAVPLPPCPAAPN
jgi:hypothetical protein